VACVAVVAVLVPVAVAPGSGATVPDPLRTIHVGGVPDRVVVGAGAVWVGDGGRVSRIDPTSDRVERIPDAATPIAIGAGALWARSRDHANTILRINPATNETVAAIDLGVDAGAIAIDGPDVWVADPAGTVTRIDANTNTVRTAIWVGSLTFGIAAGPDAVWVSGRTFDDQQAVLWRIDPTTNAVVATIVTPVNCGALAGESGITWVECITARRIDASRNTLVSTRAGALWGLAVADGAAWALGQGRTLARINNLNDTVRTIATPAGSEGIAVGYGAVWIADPDVAGFVTRDGQGSLTRIPTIRFGPPSSCATCAKTASRPSPTEPLHDRPGTTGKEPGRARSIA